MPPPTVETRYACLFTQQMMDAILGRNDPNAKKQHTLGFTNALTSEANTNGFEQIQTGIARPTPGSPRVLSVYYRIPGICPTINQGEALVCKDDEPDEYNYADQLVYVENYHHSKIELSRQTFQDACEGLTEELAKKVLDAVYNLKRAENKFFIDKYLSNLCAYWNGQDSTPGSGTEQIVKMFNDTGQPNAMSLFKVIENFARLGYTGETPIAVGGTGVQAWMMAQGIFQGNVDGFDITKIPFNMPTFTDYDYDIVVGDGVKRLATWIPGSVQRLTWLKFQEGSEFRIDQPTITKTTINVDGDVFDYSINNDGCKDTVLVTVGRGYDLFIPEAPVYDNTDPDGCGRGVCPRLSWITDCADLDCTDTINATDPIAP